MSKRWRVLFSSESLCAAFLLPSPLPHYQEAALRFPCQYNLQRGLFHESAMYCWHPCLSQQSEQLVSYCAGKLAWLQEGERTVCVGDFITGTVSKIKIETEGIITLVHLTQHYLFVQVSRYRRSTCLLPSCTKNHISKPLAGFATLGSCRPIVVIRSRSSVCESSTFKY